MTSTATGGSGTSFGARVDAHLFWPTEPYREDRSVLVAGCGTSQAAKYALRWPHAKVTGIDVSATSIQRTEKLKRKYRLDNLEVRQIAVERAGELGRRFDQVVSTGVLHHLPDPDAGLRSLRDVLEPGGAMHLMVYAPYGRAGVYMLQDVLPQARYRHDDVGDPRPCSQPQSASAGSPARAPAAPCTGLPGRGCARRCAPASSGPACTRCRSCSTSYVKPVCSSGAGCGRRRTCINAARWRPLPTSRC